MLDRVRAAPAPDVWPAQTEAADTVTLSDAVAFLQQRFWLIAIVVLAVMTLAALHVVSTPAQYVASAQLLIEPGRQQALWRDGSVVDLTIDNAQVESQVEVLLSERIANDVIATLGLVKDPEFDKGGASDYERQRATLSQFESGLSARRIGQSYVIEVSFRSRDPAKAAQITNAVTAAYLREQQSAKHDAAQQASKWMEERIADLGVQLNNAAAAVQQFRVAQGIADTGNGNQPRLIDKLTELEARAQAYRKVYETLLERLTESQQQTSYPGSDARVITTATRPLVKSYPKTSLIMLLSILVGLVIGVGVAAARAMLDGSIQSAKQIRNLLDLPCLGLLPTSRFEDAKRGAASGGDAEIVEEPLSRFSEAMRNVKISVQNALRGKRGGCIGILSLLPDEGTSSVALNLGASFAGAGAKTLLIDADFNGRSLSRRLAPGARIGLIEALSRGAADAIVYDRRTRLNLLPLVVDGPLPYSADLLDSPAMEALLSQLRDNFATILVDLPALKRAVGVRAVAPLLDGCILVAVHGRTPLRELEEAVDLLRSDGVDLLGVVLAQVPEGIPPLLGVHLDQVSEFDYAGYVHRLRRMAAR